MRPLLLICLLWASAAFAQATALPPNFGEEVSIRHELTPCAYYLMVEGNHEKAHRLTQTQDPAALENVLDHLSKNPDQLLERLSIENLDHVTIGSVGTELNKARMRQEAAHVRKLLDERGLQHIPVRVFPRPFTFMQAVRWQLPIAIDRVPSKTQDLRNGVQIAAAANLSTWIALAFLDPQVSESASDPKLWATAFLLTLPTVSANVALDFLLGTQRPTINNFLARAGSSRVSAYLRDVQLSLLFAVPFYLIPRFREFAGNALTEDASFYAPFLDQEWGVTARAAGIAVATGGLEILTSAMIQALQIFTFMNPNAALDKDLIHQGTPLSEQELSKRNTWRIAGFFALTSPLFAASNNPAVQPVLGPFTVPHLTMAGLSAVHFLYLLHNPHNLLRFPFRLYQDLGQFLSEYPIEYGIYRPLRGIVSAWKWLRGN